MFLEAILKVGKRKTSIFSHICLWRVVYEKAISVLDSSQELNLEVEYPPLLRKQLKGCTMNQKEFMIGERQGEGGKWWNKHIFSSQEGGILLKWLYFLDHIVTLQCQIIVIACQIHDLSKANCKSFCHLCKF